MFLMGCYCGDQEFSSDEEEFYYLAETIQELKSSPDFYPSDHQSKIEILAYLEPEFLAVRDKIWAKHEISEGPYGLMTPVPAHKESVFQDAEGTDQFNPAAHPKQIERGAPGPDFEDSEFSKTFEKAAWLKEKARERLDIEQLPIKTIAEYSLKKEALRVLDLEVESIRSWIKNKGDVSSKLSFACPVTHGEAAQADAKCPDQFKQALYQHPIGGAPKSSITEAVEWAFAELSKTGNTEIIKPGKIKFFLQYLKEFITEANPNFSDYVAERIKEIKAVNGDCQIIMQNFTDKDKLQFEKTGKNRVIKKTRISTILSELRDKK